MKKMFTNIEGQERVVSVLISQLEKDNLSHAYLLLGSEGVGKEYLAREFARYILCPNLADDDCDSCHRFKVGSHPDFIYINGEEGIKIEAVREVIERINLSPNMSAHKVIVFSAAENFGNEAANALLKTLEEPPTDSIIVMTAVSEKSLPQTVVSRVQKLKLRDLEVKEVEKILAKKYSESEVKKALGLAKNNLKKAVKLLDNSDYAIEVENLNQDLNNFMSTTSVIDKFKLIEKYEKSKKLKLLFDAYAERFFEEMRRQVVENANTEILENLGNKARKILKIYTNLNYNVNLRIALEELTLESQINE